MYTIVRMKKSYGSNVPGDVCGFPTATAEKLVEQGAAIELDVVEDPLGDRALHALQAVSEKVEQELSEKRK